MPRPWAGEGEGEPPSGDGDSCDDGETAPIPKLDPPWPDGDVTDLWSISEDDRDPEPDVRFPDPVSSWSEPWSEPTPCLGARRQVRPLHCRRSRHSFEPEDLSDADLDRLLRGASPGGHLSTGGWSWPAWAKFALATGVLLVVVGVVGVLTAVGDTGDNPDTITTRGQSRPTRPTRPSRPPPATTTAAHPGAAEEEPPALPPTSSPSLPPTAAPQQPTTTGTVQAPPPAHSSGAVAALPDSAADAASKTTAGPCRLSYEPCVPVAEDADCDDDDQACE